MNLPDVCRALANSCWFQKTILGVIVLAAILVGIETYPSAMADWGDWLRLADKIILWIFVVELFVRIVAYGAKPWRFFYDGWNVFDFVIVVICFLPLHTEYAAVLRLARVLRALRLVTALPRLKILVDALLRSLPSMGYIALLLFLLFYIYGVLATKLFSANDPVHFGNLQTSMVSLFRVVTLEDWTDLMYIQMYGADQYGYDGVDPAILAVTGPPQPYAQPIVSVVFFVSFILFGTMIMLNLLIGVVLNAMQELHDEAERRDQLKDHGGKFELAQQVNELEAKAKELMSLAGTIRAQLKRTDLSDG